MVTKIKSKSTSTGKKKQAIDAKRGNVFFPNPFEVVVLGIDTSDPPAGDDLNLLLHKHRITKPLAPAMLKSISKLGVKRPITIAKLWLPAGMTLRGRKMAQAEQHNVVIDGRRRVLHMRKLSVEAGDPTGAKGTYTIKADKPETGMNVYELSLLANELNAHSHEDSPLEKAMQSKLQYARSNKIEEIAESFGVGVHQLHEWWKLLESPEEIKDAVRRGPKKGGIGATPAIQLTRLPPKEQVEVLDKAMDTGKTSTAQVRGLVQEKLAEMAGVPEGERPSIKPTMREIGVFIEYLKSEEYDDPSIQWGLESFIEALEFCHDGIASERVTKIRAELERKAKEEAKEQDASDSKKNSDTKAKAAKPKKMASA